MLGEIAKPVSSLGAIVEGMVKSAMSVALPPTFPNADPEIRRSERADFQVNGMMSIAKKLGVNPRVLAGDVVEKIKLQDQFATFEVAGPGFINVTLSDQAILSQVAFRLGDDRLGCPTASKNKTIVIDYSQPNIAKEMHVGHLRSTIIGDSLARVLTFRGHKVIRQNHLGDWGTQFGMLIQYLLENEEINPTKETSTEKVSSDISDLNRMYRAARELFDSDPEFVQRSRKRVVSLQAGDEETIDHWNAIVAESKRYFRQVYDRLNVLLTEEDAVGESFYNSMLDEVALDLEARNVAVRSQGALCVFFDDIVGPDGNQVPLIVQKADGGYGYATTDLAAIRYRAKTLQADVILYVVDSRQALHFKMVFEAARRAGYIDDKVVVSHVSFGSVLGPDGRPFKTRAGDVVRLIALLDDAVDRARQTILEKNPDLGEGEALLLAREVGIGAVKYADLSTSRTRDYIFDVDRMLSLQGNTGAYLQYAHARICSILNKFSSSPPIVRDDVVMEPPERRLALLVDGLPDVLAAVEETSEPHKLASYLYELAHTFTTFYEQCPVLRAPSETIRQNRVALCELTAKTLELGLHLLGIDAPNRL